MQFPLKHVISFSSQQLDSEAEIHELQDREFGEDAVMAWATAGLASSIVLRKNEHGAYFRWLARTVLYNASKGAGDSVDTTSASGAPGQLQSSPSRADSKAPAAAAPVLEPPAEESVDAAGLPDAMLTKLRLDLGFESIQQSRMPSKAATDAGAPGQSDEARSSSKEVDVLYGGSTLERLHPAGGTSIASRVKLKAPIVYYKLILQLHYTTLLYSSILEYSNTVLDSIA